MVKFILQFQIHENEYVTNGMKICTYRKADIENPNGNTFTLILYTMLINNIRYQPI